MFTHLGAIPGFSLPGSNDPFLGFDHFAGEDYRAQKTDLLSRFPIYLLQRMLKDINKQPNKKDT